MVNIPSSQVREAFLGGNWRALCIFRNLRVLPMNYLKMRCYGQTCPFWQKNIQMDALGLVYTFFHCKVKVNIFEINKNSWKCPQPGVLPEGCEQRLDPTNPVARQKRQTRQPQGIHEEPTKVPQRVSNCTLQLRGSCRWNTSVPTAKTAPYFSSAYTPTHQI